MGETEHQSFSWFRDFRMCPWAPKQFCLLWRHQDTSTISRENPNCFKICVGNFKIIGNRQIWKNGKDTCQETPTIRVRILWNSGIWDQYLPEKMKWNVGNMGSVASQNIKWVFWIYDFLEHRNLETMKPRNQETETLRNLESKKRRNQGTNALLHFSLTR